MKNHVYNLMNSQEKDYLDLPSVSQNYFKNRFVYDPWRQKYYVPAERLEDVTEENRFNFFIKPCPICGKKISGRPAEYPHYRLFGSKVLFLCRYCSHLRNILIQDVAIKE